MVLYGWLCYMWGWWLFLFCWLLEGCDLLLWWEYFVIWGWVSVVELFFGWDGSGVCCEVDVCWRWGDGSYWFVRWWGVGVIWFDLLLWIVIVIFCCVVLFGFLVRIVEDGKWKDLEV